MDEKEVIDVRVVAVQPNRIETIKDAALSSIVTVFVTTATASAMSYLAARVAARNSKPNADLNVVENNT